LSTLGPVFVTPAPAKTEAAAAVPKLMVVGVAALAVPIITLAMPKEGINSNNAPIATVFRYAPKAALNMKHSFPGRIRPAALTSLTMWR
jgi:hypothetical protein